MKAVVWKQLNRISYEDVPEPEARPGWVKLKVLATGLCATEVHLITGKFAAAVPPAILGHEICGQVVAVGEGCDKAAIGRRAVVETYVGCGKCIYCRTGRKHLCTAGEVGYPPYSGGHAQYTVVPEKCLHFLPPEVSDDEGGILEGVACPYGAVLDAGVKMGQTVLVQGAGIAGLSFLQAARAAGAGKTICAVRRDERIAQAKHFGADVIVDLRREDLYSRVLEETDGRGADVSVDAAGAASTVEAAIRCTAPGGQVILYGIPDQKERIDLPVTDIILRQIRLCGYTGNEFGWDPLIAMTAKGQINVKDMVSYRFPLSRFQEAMELMERRPADLIKVVLHPWEEV